MKKKILSLCLMMMICLIALPQPASAEGFVYNFDQTAVNPGPHCSSLLMLNVDTGTIVYSDNPDDVVPMASLTKIMSYIIAYEYIPDLYNAVITVPESVATELEGTMSSEAGLMVGEQFNGEQLLYLMMVPSGNDAALTLAKHVDGMGITRRSLMPGGGSGGTDSSAAAEGTGSEAGDGSSGDGSGTQEADNLDETVTFVDLMNMKARELGCENTHFVNPHGLHDTEHYSTARDLMKIVMYARNLPDFTTITSTLYYETPQTNMRAAGQAKNFTTNYLLTQSNPDYFYTYATGIKTGSLNESGYCIAASAVYSGYTYIVIALGSPYIDGNGDKIDFHGEMKDSAELFRWAFTELEMKTVATSGDLLGNTNLRYAWQQDKLQAVAADNVSVILPKNVEQSSIITTIELPENVDAPVQKGAVIGTATMSYADEVIATVDLVAAESVERSDIMMTLEQGKAVFTSKWFLIVVGIILVLVVIYIILVLLYRNKQKRLKKVRKFRDM